MTHETLYKRTKTGAIAQWSIEIEPEDLDHTPTIIKKAGQVNGKLTTHREAIWEGKNIGKSNETTPLQQAEAQALSDWTRKHDEGYKSLSDLDEMKADRLYSTDNPADLKELLEKFLPQFNTDAAGNVKPMLAKAVNWAKVTYPCLVQPKLDGVRCLMVVDAPIGAIRMLSRSGKEYSTLSHIAADVARYIEDNMIQGGFILDGEVYSESISFQQIIAAVKKQRPDSLKLKFRAYDTVNDLTQDKRIMQTEQLVHNIASEHVQMVGTEGVTFEQGKDRIMDLHNTWVSQGYEGAMIRLRDGLYGQGQRSSALMKVKEFEDTEFAFKNFEFGQRGVEDLIAVLWSTDGELEFRAKVVGNLAEKKELYELNDESEGRSFTIKHQGYTEDNLPRFPIGKGFRLKEDT